MVGSWTRKNLRPEEEYSDPREFYTKEETEHYARSKTLRRIQQKMAIELVDLLNASPPAKVLDVGCGPGFSMEVFEELGFEVYGLDLVPEMVGIAQDRGFNVVLGDMRELWNHFDFDYFDYVFSISAFQWISKNPQDVERFARGLIYVLKQGGKAGIQFYPFSEEELNSVEHVFKKYFRKVDVVILQPNTRKERIYVLLEF